MRCTFCRVENPSPLIPVPVRLPDGSYEAFSCLACARKEGVYCDKHQSHHIGFDDCRSACPFCIEEFIAKERYRADRVIQQVLAALKPEEAQYLCRIAMVATGSMNGDRGIEIFALVAKKAWRDKISIDDVVRQVSGDRSCRSIVGWCFRP